MIKDLKQLNPIILVEDNIYLAQVSALILYVECYNLVFNNSSIANAPLELKQITIFPFVLLIAAIAFSKIGWFYTICLLPLRFSKGNKDISKRTSYSCFIMALSVIVFVFVSILRDNKSIFNVQHSDQPILFSFLATVLLGGGVISGYVFLSYEPKIEEWS
jgi:uncharacterized protein with PQ loop repeat